MIQTRQLPAIEYHANCVQNCDAEMVEPTQSNTSQKVHISLSLLQLIIIFKFKSERKTSMTGESLYVILGIEKSADQEQIKKAYRKRALRLHPDKNHDNPDKEKLEGEFKELNRVCDQIVNNSSTYLIQGTQNPIR